MTGPGTTGRRLVVAAVVGAVVLVVVATQRRDLAAAAHEVHLADPRWLLALAAALLLWWAAWTALHATALAGVTRVRAADLPEIARGAVTAVALNSVVTSAGLAGLAPMARAGRRRRMPRAEVASGYLLAATVTDLGFLLVLVAGFGVLGTHGRLTGLDLLAGGLFLALTTGRVALTVLAVRRPAALHTLLARTLRVKGWVLRRPVEEPDPARTEELVGAAELVTSRPARAVPPLLAATVVDVAGVLMLWAALAAVGGPVDVGLALSAYVLASVAAILGPIPGGVGAAEVGAAAALTVGGVPLGVAAAATLLFRVAEFWVPLAVGGLAWVTARPRGGVDVVRQGRWVRRGSALVAAVVGVAALAAVVAVVPHPEHRPVPGLRPLEGAVAAVEGGRYLLLGAGLVLLLVVRALLRGRRAAWLAAVAALAAATVGSLVVHRHVPVSVVLGVLTVLVGLGGRAFVARGDPMLVRRGIAVLVGGAAIVGTVATVGLYQLDGQFRGGTTFWGSAGTATRLLLMLPVDAQPLTRHAEWLVSASRGAALAVVLAGAAMLVAAVSGGRQHEAERAVVTRLLDRWATTSLAHFQLLPDKRWLIGADGEAFVGYGLHGRTAVALGGPIGAPGSRRAAAQEFLELCRRNGWTPGFHQVTADELDDLAPLGLRAYKIGEEAVVELAGGVAPEGRAGKSIRSAVRRCERAGYRVVELAHPLADADLARLREVSDAWSADGEHRERTFALGQFDAEQLRATPVLAVVDADDRVQAFANTLPAYRSGDRSFDLMRRRPGSVNGVMDQLFVGMGERFAAAGGTGMNLGLAPFTGLADQQGVPARVMRLLHDHGGALLDYAGLRSFKDKWAPRWEPRYLVTAGDSALPRVAVAVARLGELPDPRRWSTRVASAVRRFPVTTTFAAVQLWLMLSSAYDPQVHRELIAAAGSSWELVARGQLWRLVTSPVVQASPGLVWVNVLLAVVFPVAEARLGSRWTAVGFFAGDLLGSVPVLLGTRLAAAVGSGAALAELREIDGGTSAGCWALIAAVVVTLPAGRVRRGAGAALLAVMVGGLVLDRGIADVQHAVSVAGVVLLLTVGRRGVRVRWRRRGGTPRGWP